ncbi:hypothetical protein GCM10009754_70740 [Amycolatopsis minnesotensis]|uniref:Uncharacterized protein n=1 Tax=Amycolatopsis minnesotensis TaxID=337894 RepID=A0ABP5DNL8_9PSEU
MSNCGRLAARVHAIRLELSHETDVTLPDGTRMPLVLAREASDITLPAEVDAGDELVAVWEADEVDWLCDFAKNGRADILCRVRTGADEIKIRDVRGYRPVAMGRDA